MAGTTYEQSKWAWWNVNFLNKRTITVTNPFVGTQYAFNLTFNVHYKNTDCSDVRFTNSTETEAIPYWIEIKSNSNWCYVWVDNKYGDSTIFEYYNNNTQVTTTGDVATTFTAYENSTGDNWNTNWNTSLTSTGGGISCNGPHNGTTSTTSFLDNGVDTGSYCIFGMMNKNNMNMAVGHSLILSVFTNSSLVGGDATADLRQYLGFEPTFSPPNTDPSDNGAKQVTLFVSYPASNSLIGFPLKLLNKTAQVGSATNTALANNTVGNNSYWRLRLDVNVTHMRVFFNATTTYENKSLDWTPHNLDFANVVIPTVYEVSAVHGTQHALFQYAQVFVTNDSFNSTTSIGPPLSQLSYTNNLTSNPIAYDGTTNSQFNATWSSGNSNGFNYSSVELNYTGTATNYTASRSSNTSYLSLVLPPGTFSWRIFANDSTNVFNNTPLLTFTINKGALKGAISGYNVVYPTSVNVVPSETNTVGTDVNYTFWRNNTLVSSAINANPSSDTSQLAVGTYVYVLNSTGGANWTSNSSIASLNVVVSKGAQRFKETITFVATQSGAGFLCTNCPTLGTEFFPIVIANMTNIDNARVVAFCDAACDANTVVQVINDADKSVVVKVNGPNAADTAKAGPITAVNLSGDINLKVRINGTGLASQDYRITHVYMEMYGS